MRGELRDERAQSLVCSPLADFYGAAPHHVLCRPSSLSFPLLPKRMKSESCFSILLVALVCHAIIVSLILRK